MNLIVIKSWKNNWTRSKFKCHRIPKKHLHTHTKSQNYILYVSYKYHSHEPLTVPKIYIITTTTKLRSHSIPLFQCVRKRPKISSEAIKFFLMVSSFFSVFRFSFCFWFIYSQHCMISNHTPEIYFLLKMHKYLLLNRKCS